MLFSINYRVVLDKEILLFPKNRNSNLAQIYLINWRLKSMSLGMEDVEQPFETGFIVEVSSK